MDHAMDYLRNYMDATVYDLRVEYKGGKYSKLSECPSYEECKAYCNSYNELVRYYYVEEFRSNVLISPSKLIKEGL